MRMRPLLVFTLASAGLASAVQAQQTGAGVFNTTCVACHGAGGQGVPGLAPALAGTLAPYLKSDDGHGYIAQVLVKGLSGKIVSQGQTFMGAMPAQAPLGDEDLAAVATYLAKDLNGAGAIAFSTADIAKARATPATHKDLRALRERLGQ